MRASRQGAVVAVVAFLCFPARAQDKPPAKVDLAYRWDLLAGKTAVYDVEVVTTKHVTEKASTDAGEADPDLTADRTPDAREGSTRTRQRLLVSFARGERERGRVTFATERLQLAVTSRSAGATETVEWDSARGDAPPEKLKATAAGLLGKPYVLVVTRRGLVEDVEGRPRSELPGLKSAFLVLPDAPRAEGDSWTKVKRDPAGPLGELVTRFDHRLAKLSDAGEGERRIEVAIRTELDDKRSALPAGTSARLEAVHGKSTIVLDGRGLRREEDERTGYVLVVKQVELEQRTTIACTTSWKLVELREGR